MITHIGLAGCGNWGRFILRDLKSLGCRVTVAARSTRSRAFAAEFGADHVVPSIGELPSGADGFVVATPTAFHHEAVSALLAFGRPVFVEKPLTNDLDSARDLESRATGRIFVMDKWRYHPGVEALRDLARSQELGPVRYIQTLRLGWSNPHEVDASWILLPHDLAITLEILGYIPDPVSAFAEYPKLLHCPVYPAYWGATRPCRSKFPPPGPRRFAESRCVSSAARPSSRIPTLPRSAFAALSTAARARTTPRNRGRLPPSFPSSASCVLLSITCEAARRPAAVLLKPFALSK